MSPSPPLRKSGKDAPFEAGLLTHGRNADLLSAPSHPSGTVAFVADFVAAYSCEGSGGFAPRFPLTSSASWLSKAEADRTEHTLELFLTNGFSFKTFKLIYAGGIDGVLRGGEIEQLK